MLDNQVSSLPLNPTDLSDPENQRKIAEDVLSQVGMHPDQLGAKKLLDQHFQGPTAHPEIQTIVPQTANDLIPSTPMPEAPKTESITLPGPGGNPSPIVKNTNAQTQTDQNELNRLIHTGSGISQVHNPFLRTLGRVGEVASDLFAPGIASAIPGTEMHHGALIKNQTGLVNNDIKNAATEASTAHTNQQTTDLENAPDKNPNELAVWIKQNPDKPIAEYWRQKQASAKLTPQELVMQHMTLPVGAGGEGLDPTSAFTKMQKMLSENKPQTTGENKIEMEGLMAKTFPDGQMDPKVMSNPQALATHIAGSPQLTPEEKAKLNSYFSFNTSPASAGGVADKRAAGQMNSRLVPGIDNTTGSLDLVTPQNVSDHPGRFIPATQGGQSMGKEAIFQDLHYNLGQTREALNGLQHGFDPRAVAQISLVLRSPNVHSAFDSFMHSETAKTLTPDQVDYVTALASLNENAMSLRSVAGMGQGSDEMRSAIKATLPGAGTPTKEYGTRQLDLLEGTINRLEQGIPKTNVPHTNVPPTPKTGENHASQSKTFTRAQVQAAADTAGISYEAAKADAEKHGHKVMENATTK